MKPRRKPVNGFTLLEMVVVVGIVAILLAVAIFAIARSKDTMTVERAAALLRTRVEKAQSIAAIAGSRLGTPRVTLDGSCVADANEPNQLWINVNGGQVTIPSRADVQGDGTIVVSCDPWDLDALTRGMALFDPGVGANEQPASFAFTADGRLIVPRGAAQPANGLLFLLRKTDDNRKFGFRVLPSGLFCNATTPNPTNRTLFCNEDST
jgi:prepilin-type N-terminal cleavage/methylation domain-containing protein